MKQPLVVVALVYVGGILLGEFLAVPLWPLLAAGFALFLATLLFPPGRRVLLMALVAATGWANQTFHTSILSPIDLRHLASDQPELVTVYGSIFQTPRERYRLQDGEESWRTLAIVDATSISRGDTRQPCLGRVAVATTGLLSPDFFDGRKISVSGVLAPPPRPFAEGLFDYHTHLRRQGIHYLLKSTTNDWQLTPGPAPPVPLAVRFLDYGRRTLSRGLPDDQARRLIWALALDWKAPLTEEVSEPFMRAGTYHIFAVDGLRIAIISAILLALLRSFQIPRRWCGLVVIPVVWFYAGATGWPASAIRSAIMLSVVVASWSFDRPANLMNSLFAAALLILLWDPQQLFQAGFQLSFFVVLSIVLLVPNLKRIHESLLAPNPLVPDRKNNGWRARWRIPLRFSIDVLVSSWAAWLGSIPLSAYYFHLVTLASVPANFIVVPLTMLTLMSSLGSLLTGLCFPAASELFNNASWFLMHAILRTTEFSVAWPATYFYVASPSWITLCLLYLVIILAGSNWIFTSPHRRWGVAAVTVAAAGWLWQWQAGRHSVDLHILSLDGGAAIFINDAEHDPLLIDCGNPRRAQSVTVPFLRAHGVNALPRVALGRSETKYIGGFDFIRTNFSVGEILTSVAPGRSPVYRDLLAGFKSAQGRQTACLPGHAMAGWTALHPGVSDHFSLGADNSLVLQREIHGWKILLLGNLGRDGQARLLEKAAALRSDIVVAGLPGRSEPLSDDLLRAIHPRLIVIPDAEFPAPERASRPLRKRLAATGIPVLYGRDLGGIKITLGPNGCAVAASNPAGQNTVDISTIY